jgi:STE24 endopeptidase
MVWLWIGWLWLHFCFEFFLSRINLIYALKKEHTVPAILQDIITQERFEKSKAYVKENTNFSNIKSVFLFLINVMLLIWVLPSLEKWDLARVPNYFWQGLFFFGAIYVIHLILNLPFAWWENFRIEQKYGFNTMTMKIFWVDLLKNIITTLILGGGFLTGVLWVIQSPIWWWQFTLLVVVFFLISMWIGPTLLMPLFNKFTPMEEGDLKESLQLFAQQHKIPVKKIFVMDASKRSTHGNAFFTGIGPTQRLVVFDTLLTYPIDEVFSIIGHEWGHWKHRDVLRQLLFIIVIVTLLFFTANLLFNSGWIQRIFHVETSYAVLYYTMAMASPLLFFIEPAMNYLIRLQEFSADRFSAQLLQSSKPGMQGLKRIISDNLSNLYPHPLYKVWYYSHPAPEERIQALKSLSW